MSLTYTMPESPSKTPRHGLSPVQLHQSTVHSPRPVSSSRIPLLRGTPLLPVHEEEHLDTADSQWHFSQAPTLTYMTGPKEVDPLDPEEDSIFGLKLPTFGMRNTLDLPANERRNHAVRLASSEYFKRTISYGKLTRSQVKKFAREIEVLDSLFETIIRKRSAGYQLNPSKLKALNQTLFKVRERYAMSLYNNGLPIPGLPRWGLHGSSGLVFDAHDFEILACCLYEEVESFLATCDAVEFDEDFDLGHQEPEPSPSVVQPDTQFASYPQKTRDSPPHFKLQETPVLTKKVGKPSLGFPDYTKGLADLNATPAFASKAVSQPKAHVESTKMEQGKEKALPVDHGSHKKGQGADAPGSSQQQSAPARPPPGPPSSPTPSSFPSRSPSPGHPRHPPHGRPSTPGSPGPPGPTGPGPPHPPHGPRTGGSGSTAPDPHRYVIDFKLKASDIPEWDGDSDTLAKWIKKITQISERSLTIYTQLGPVVPQRLTGSAEKWYWSQPVERRRIVEQNWSTLRAAIKDHFMNRTWLDQQKTKANKASYRDFQHLKETPSDYYIRKLDLLTLVYQMSPTELIMEIMNGAPPSWVTVLNPQLYDDLTEFQNAIKYHENHLMRMSQYRSYGEERKEPSSNRKFFRNARTNLVGWTSKLGAPKFPKDDKNVSKRTPKSIGARPCRHCGSEMHWDPECKHAKKGIKAARTNAAILDTEEMEAQEEYDDLYYGLSDDEDIEHEDQQDFCEPPQIQETSTLVTHANEQGPEDTSDLGGNQANNSPPTGQEISGQQDNSPPIATMEATANKVQIIKPPLNRRSRRRLARDISKHSNFVTRDKFQQDRTLVSLKKIMARPPGTSFLGSKATKVSVDIGELEQNTTDVILDSGSDITLISQSTLEGLSIAPKVRNGHKINLIQVTGKSSISGFANLDLYFKTPEGPVHINVDAYVVKGMLTPLILGNDYADQYSISIIRNDGKSYVQFGKNGRMIQVENSTSPALMDDEGHTFKIAISRKYAHHKALKTRTKIKKAAMDPYVRAAQTQVIPTETSKLIKVKTHFPPGQDCIYMEKVFFNARSLEDVYAAPDSLISKDNPAVHIANFSSYPITVNQGQIIGIKHNPQTWLASRSRCTKEELNKLENYAKVICNLAHTGREFSDMQVGMTLSEAQDVPGHNSEQRVEEDPLAEEPLTGGPKSHEVPPDMIEASKLLDVVDISPELTKEQHERLTKVILQNQMAFGLDNRLGHYAGEMEINLRPGAKEVSLPPFGLSSPVKREAMDKQMDVWLKLGVISPSKSPWGAPAFIVYRNEKPRMVVDYRKLNEMTIPDEFPLPKQEDILQALTGTQWLSTLDALSGFTQIPIAVKDKEKTGFRTHRGLHHFNRMPFGLTNGPSTFQRIMQTVLAPFLWVFALVYIDDIVVYSYSFEEHLEHLKKVFKAFQQANLTLSPQKCHFAYQSLLLLGQKVSRLGLSTHKEKVDTILNLAEPRNVRELQSFLGMMVYFSAYIPFYSWIAQPLFQLLKKDNKWDWGPTQAEAFELCKQVLTNAPVRAYAIPGLPYRIYTDACDYGLAAILQQVQPIKIKDLKGTRAYDKLRKAYDHKDPVPSLVIAVAKQENEIPKQQNWAENFEDTIVHVERVISYWSRILKSAERNYSPTEREALALKEGLIKFQPFLEGEEVTAITDHAALTWTRTYQNVNRRLLSWGAVLSGYPKLKIVHRAGRVHSNVDPVSRLRRRIPHQTGPSEDATGALKLSSSGTYREMCLDRQSALDIEDPLKNMYEELGPKFEEKLLQVAAHHVSDEERIEPSNLSLKIETSMFSGQDNSIDLDYITSASYSLLVEIIPEEMEKWKQAYFEDPLFSEVLKVWKKGNDQVNSEYPQYHYSDEGLLYFEDWNGNNRLCVPASLRIDLIKEAHDLITEAAHGGHFKTYNRLAPTYYWPKMSRDIKRYTDTCDICQKSKPRRHAPMGLLQPLPIPNSPFEVVTMDFITELPESHGYDSILVIVDKLTKYGIFVPTHTTVTEEETAKLIFKHVISKFGIPQQFISDRDRNWKGEFWKHVCKLLDSKRSLATSYHPQTDGQTEILNQGLEIALRAYIGPSRDDWVDHLDGLALSYNSGAHTATGFPPAFLLRGYVPRTSTTLMHSRESIPRNLPEDLSSPGEKEEFHESALELVSQFEELRDQAKEALLLGQIYQRKAYNRQRIATEFEEGDLVVWNPHSLKLLRNEKGKGQKFLMRYEGPFEVIQKLSPVAYRLRMPASYGINPIINIMHLEKYNKSPDEFGDRPMVKLSRDDFKALPEYEVERIIAQKVRKQGKRRIRLYKTRFMGYGPEFDEWLTARQLRNAPEVLMAWEHQQQ